MPPHMLDTFIRVFSRIPQLVFWKWEKAGDEEKMPANVKTLSWVPQQDLLGDYSHLYNNNNDYLIQRLW